ncbi:hypothetical protein J7E73_22270, partial [Paenibacillus albidus]|nr:hypothetical protein [Paenibacillus albidus]
TIRVGHLLYLEIVFVVNNNFSNKAGCPSSVCLFDKSSNHLTLIPFVRQHVFYKTQVNYKKIVNAELILLTRDVSVLETASLVGMPNMASFYKIFYKYIQCSPKEFRKKLL